MGSVEIGYHGEVTLTYYQYEHMDEPDVTLEYLEKSHDYWSGDTDVSVNVSRDQARAIVQLLAQAFGPGIKDWPNKPDEKTAYPAKDAP